MHTEYRKILALSTSVNTLCRACMKCKESGTSSGSAGKRAVSWGQVRCCFCLLPEGTPMKWGIMFLSPTTDLSGPALHASVKLIGKEKRRENNFAVEREGVDLGWE